MNESTLVITNENIGKRLDVFISETQDITRSYAKTLIEKQCILVNKNVVKAGYSLKNNDVITFYIPEPQTLDLEPENIPIDIIYEDDDLAIINKAQGMVVHPAPGSYNHTLVNALLYHLNSLSSINGVIRPGIVHRLDKDTSGLLVIAKNNDSHIELQRQIQTKEAKRYYKAIVDGIVKKDEGIIDTFIDRNQKDRTMMAVTRNGKGREAITYYKVLERFNKYTYMEYELKTGRTHQIRVHSKHIGHPIIGDSVYGGSNKFNLKGQLLHAYKLTLTHPRTKDLMTFTCDLPDYFNQVLDLLHN